MLSSDVVERIHECRRDTTAELIAAGPGLCAVDVERLREVPACRPLGVGLREIAEQRPAAMAEAIGARVEPVPVPWDSAGGLFEACWRRRERIWRTVRAV